MTARSNDLAREVALGSAALSGASPADFIRRWQDSGSAERANYQMFLAELCRDVLGVAPPHPSVANDEKNVYVFERTVRFQHGDGTVSTGRIDLYKRSCFVLETKQGVAAASAADAHALFAAPKSIRPRAGRELRPRPPRRRGQPAVRARRRRRPHDRAVRRLLPSGDLG